MSNKTNNIMKKLISIFFLGTVIFTLLIGCDEEEGLTEGSNLNPPPASDDALDQWIKENYVDPFNIEVVYKWQESLVDQDRYLFPPHKDSVQFVLELVKSIWINPYNQTADTSFVQGLKPSQIVLVGGQNTDPSGTAILGLAEAGKRITLFEVNLFERNNEADLDLLIILAHHEYAHILHQSKPFDEEGWRQITPSGYTAQWFNESDEDSQALGFITAYARANEYEDFAEMVSQMLLRSRGEWNALIEDFGVNTSAIRAKEQILVSYYKDQHGLDLYELQESVYNAKQRALRQQ